MELRTYQKHSRMLTVGQDLVFVLFRGKTGFILFDYHLIYVAYLDNQLLSNFV